MRFRFRGVRGSIPSPGPKTVKYGGNTTCIEVRGDGGELIIFDGGTGIYPLAQDLLKELPLDCNIFLTHTHWDHIQGLPFFIPIFIPGNRLTIHGPADPITQRGIGEVLSLQLQYAYFPVREAELKARIEYNTLHERQSIEIGGARVTSIMMNHPVINLGYKVECDGQSLFFTGDHEWYFNIYDPEEPEYAQFQEHIESKRQSLIDFIRGVDVLIADTAYTEPEYPAKVGWGHSTFDMTIAAAREAGVKKTFFTHHEPSRSDADLEEAFQKALEANGCGRDGDPEFHLAREGVLLEV